MEIAPGLLPPFLEWLGQALYWPLLAAALWRAEWSVVTARRYGQVFLGTCVAVLVLWQIRAALAPLPAVHLLGATLLSVMFGPRLALAGLAAVLAASTWQAGEGWRAIGINGLLTGALPVLVSARFERLVRRRLPPNPFVFLFLAAFAAAALAVAAVGAAGAALLGASGAAGLVRAQLGASLLLLFPEAFVTGTLVTAMVVIEPRWVRGFREHYHLP